MAYEIISQNNTTTTLSDGTNTIVVPGRVVLATSSTYEITDVNNNTATLEGSDGSVIRDVPCVAVLYGGGSSDTHNKGYFATQAALEEAYPTAEPGDYAIVGATDTIWIWDEDTTVWVDTDTKGQVQSVNSKTGVVVLDANDVSAVPQYSIMPMAGASNVGTVQYIGTTDSTYTHNYFYENVATAVYDSTVSFEAATLSSSTIACSGSDFAAFVAEWGSGDITTITHGTLTYDQSGGLLVFVGKDTEETTVCTFQLYTEDYQDAGFTITGTLQDGDVFAFTTAITESFTYAWSRKDVQPTSDPLPSQTGQSGKFLTTDGTDPSWATISALQNTATGTDALTILGTAATTDEAINIGVGSSAIVSGIAIGNGTSTGVGGVSIGKGATTYGYNQGGDHALSVAIGEGSSTRPDYNANKNVAILGSTSRGRTKNMVAIAGDATCSAGQDGDVIAIGGNANNQYGHLIQLGDGTNTTFGTFQVWSHNLLNKSDGTIPTDRFTTTPVADGTYVPTLTISSGVATRTWGAAATAPVVPATMPTLAVADWSSNTQTVNVTGVTASNIVFVSPAPASAADYAAAGIVCTAQGSGTLTFTCTTVPSNAITVNVVILG